MRKRVYSINFWNHPKWVDHGGESELLLVAENIFTASAWASDHLKIMREKLSAAECEGLDELRVTNISERVDYPLLAKLCKEKS